MYIYTEMDERKMCERMLGLVRFSDYRPAQAAELVARSLDRATLRRIASARDGDVEWEDCAPADGEPDVLEVAEGLMYTWQIVSDSRGLPLLSSPRRRVVRRPYNRPPPPVSDALLRPAAACPRCGARPAMRVTVAMAEAMRVRPRAERVATYQCQRRGCGAVYDLTAGAYQCAA